MAGNPNCGKTTLFNEITGSKQHVGNWPGVTVEKKEGKYKKDKTIKVTVKNKIPMKNQKDDMKVLVWRIYWFCFFILKRYIERQAT